MYFYVWCIIVTSYICIILIFDIKDTGLGAGAEMGICY